MPRKTKTKTKIKNKNKNKVVVRNVININSNNTARRNDEQRSRMASSRKGITKPSFQQLSQQPRSSGSTVVSHFVQQPTSAYQPQQQSQNDNALLKAMDKYENLVNKYAEREAVLYNDSLNRLRSNLKAPKPETPLQDAGLGRIFTFEQAKSPIGSVKSEPAPKTPMKSLLGGRRPSPLGFPEENTLSPLSRVGLSEAEVKRQLEIMGATATADDRNKGRKYLRQAYRVIGATAPDGLNTKPSTMINDLLVNSREGIAKHWTAIKDIPNQFRLVSEAQGGGGKATKKVPERAKSK